MGSKTTPGRVRSQAGPAAPSAHVRMEGSAVFRRCWRQSTEQAIALPAAAVGPARRRSPAGGVTRWATTPRAVEPLSAAEEGIRPSPRSPAVSTRRWRCPTRTAPGRCRSATPGAKARTCRRARSVPTAMSCAPPRRSPAQSSTARRGTTFPPTTGRQPHRVLDRRSGRRSPAGRDVHVAPPLACVRREDAHAVRARLLAEPRPRRARHPVLVLLSIQRMDQPPRGRLGARQRPAVGTAGPVEWLSATFGARVRLPRRRLRVLLPRPSPRHRPADPRRGRAPAGVRRRARARALVVGQPERRQLSLAGVIPGRRRRRRSVCGI